MPPKKGKKSKKKSKKKEVLKTEWDDLELPDLENVVSDMTYNLAKLKKERDQIQTEHETVQKYQDDNIKVLADIDQNIRMTEDQVRDLEEDNAIEMSIYVQKVKHIEYQQNLKMIGTEELRQANLEEEKKESALKIFELSKEKSNIMDSLHEKQIVNAHEIAQIKESNTEELNSIQQQLKHELDSYEKKCNERQKELIDELSQNKENEIIHVRERCKLHLEQLERRHQETFEENRQRFSVIENETNNTIQKLSKSNDTMAQTILKYTDEIESLKTENMRLTKPLEDALEEVKTGKNTVKDMAKDKSSLCNTNARILVVDKKLKEQIEINRNLELQMTTEEKERNELKELCEKFSNRISDSTKSNVFTKDLKKLKHQISATQSQLMSIINEKRIDKTEVKDLSAALGDLLTQKNTKIEHLQLQLTLAQKKYDNTIKNCHSNSHMSKHQSTLDMHRPSV